MHLGGKHGYINQVLMMKGLSVLPCTVNSTGYSAAKQKMLCRIKKERREEEEAGGAHEDIRKQLELEMESPSNANNGATEEILEKYKNII